MRKKYACVLNMFIFVYRVYVFVYKVKDSVKGFMYCEIV